MKIYALGIELFHADGQIDMTKLVVAFRNFVNAPKNRIVVYINTVSTKAGARELKVGCMYVR